MTGMEMEVAVRARLKASAALTAMIGQRVDWGLRAGPVLPAITLTRIPGPKDTHYKGDQGLQETRVQVDAWAPDYATAMKVAHMARMVLEPPEVVAAIPPNMEAGVRFERSFAEQPDPATESTATGVVHRARFDIAIWWALTV
jgi:hypothetical protein